jgi:hypothetical protein
MDLETLEGKELEALFNGTVLAPRSEASKATAKKPAKDEVKKPKKKRTPKPVRRQEPGPAAP